MEKNAEFSIFILELSESWINSAVLESVNRKTVEEPSEDEHA